MHNKKKIINDPLYGFIGIPSEITYDLINHPWFGRLRNIRQLGLTHFVYPGAVHTRFHHALGTLHLVNLAIDTLLQKGIKISNEEADGLRSALLLHDIGHSPFSHSLENILVKCSHEQITQKAMEKLDLQYSGQLEMARSIFDNTYPRYFFHQLVSGQMDLDRLDYLNRDSFYTGVSEGVVSYDRILKMIYAIDDELVLEEKALYSIEKFLLARRLMYWQVYLHKTVIASEQMLVKVLKRAKELIAQGQPLFCTPSLRPFISQEISGKFFLEDEDLFEKFMDLDDSDIWSAIKVWAKEKDPVLAQLSISLTRRNLYHIELQNEPFSDEKLEETKLQILKRQNIPAEELSYYIFTGKTNHLAYNRDAENIYMIKKNRSVHSFLELSDFFRTSESTVSIEKHYLCYFRF